MSKVKQCPFCTEFLEVQAHPFWHGKTKADSADEYPWRVRCPRCGWATAYPFDTEADAIWWANDRPLEAKLAKQLQSHIALIPDGPKLDQVVELLLNFGYEA